MQIKGDDEYPHVEGTRPDLRYEVHYWSKSLADSWDPADWSNSNAFGKEGTEVDILVYKP